MNTPAFLLLLLAFALSILGSRALAPGLVCPQPDPYPKSYWRDMIPASWGFTGTFNVSGVVMDASFNKLAEINGDFLQYYVPKTKRYIAQYFIRDQGVPDLLMEMTFSPLLSDKTSPNNAYCLVFNPRDLVPYYVQGTPITDQFFYTTYYHRNDTGTGTFGDVAETEYFFFNEFGNALLPQKWRENPTLGKWASNQRYLLAKQRLASSRCARLDQLGFWDTKFSSTSRAKTNC